MNTNDVLRAAFPLADPDSNTSFYTEIGDVFTALAFSDLFWPQCFERYGAIFVGVGATSPEWVEQGVERILARPESERRSWPEIVDSFNWFEVPYLFRVLRDPAELIGEASYQLAGVLRDCWSARLRELYPEREFDVSVDEPTKNEALSIAVRQVAPILAIPSDR